MAAANGDRGSPHGFRCQLLMQQTHLHTIQLRRLFGCELSDRAPGRTTAANIASMTNRAADPGESVHGHLVLVARQMAEDAAYTTPSRPWWSPIRPGRSNQAGPTPLLMLGRRMKGDRLRLVIRHGKKPLPPIHINPQLLASNGNNCTPASTSGPTRPHPSPIATSCPSPTPNRCTGIHMHRSQKACQTPSAPSDQPNQRCLW